MMASIRNPSPSQPSPGLDRQTADPAQGVADLGAAGWGVEGWNPASTHGGRLRMRTLVTLRWMIIAGELLIFAAILTAFCIGLFRYALGLALPVAPWLIGY